MATDTPPLHHELFEAAARHEIFELLRTNGYDTTCVSTTVWAVLWLADINRLRELAKQPSTLLALVYALPAGNLTKLWQQRLHPSRASTPSQPATPNQPGTDVPLFSLPSKNPGTMPPPDTMPPKTPAGPSQKRRRISTPGVSPGTPLVKRDQAQQKLTKARDKSRCVLTGMDLSVELCHVVAFCFHPDGKLSQQVNNFFALLDNFWPQESVRAWKEEVTAAKLDTCANMITLTRNAHAWWAEGAWALKPIRTEESAVICENAVICEFHWLRKEPRQYVDLFMTPELQCEYDSFGINGINMTKAGLPLTPLRSGDEVRLTTTDPVTMPLPSLAVLGLQWYMSRIVALSAAADVDDVPWSDPDFSDLSLLSDAPVTPTESELQVARQGGAPLVASKHDEAESLAHPQLLDP